MPRIREAVREHAELFALVDHRLIDVLGHRDGTERHVRRCDRLRHRDGVRLHVERLRSEHIAGAPEAADDLVRDEGDVIVAQDRLDFLEVGLRRHNHATRTHDRLGDERRDRLRALALDQRFELASKARGELFLGLAFLAVAIEVRLLGVQNPSDRKIEIGMEDRDAGKAAGRDRHAMVGVYPRDDLLLVRLADGVVVIPLQLDLRIIGLAAGAGEEHLGSRAWRDFLDLLCELHRRLVATPTEKVGERQLAHLLRGRLDQLVIAVAERRAPQSRQPLDVFFARRIIDVNAFRTLQHHRPVDAMCRQIGRRVQNGLDVASCKVAEGAHGTGPVFARNLLYE